MGLLNKLFGRKAASEPTAEQEQTHGSLTPDEILESGSLPAKPSVLRQEVFFDGENAEEEWTYQFLLSGDFVEFNSHAEPEACHQYEPFLEEEFTGYDPKLLTFMLSNEDMVWDAVETFKKTGTVGTDCRPVNAGKMLFRTKIPYYDQVMTFYGFDRGNSWENFGMCMVYNRDVEGTPLEAKLLAALDEAAASYREMPTQK